MTVATVYRFSPIVYRYLYSLYTNDNHFDIHCNTFIITAVYVSGLLQHQHNIVVTSYILCIPIYFKSYTSIQTILMSPCTAHILYVTEWNNWILKLLANGLNNMVSKTHSFHVVLSHIKTLWVYTSTMFPLWST